MSLRRQLFLVSLITLILPWAGYQFLREMEATLRQGQQQALADIARVLAQQVINTQEGTDRLQTPIAAATLYAHRLPAPPILDGYTDDWDILDAIPESAQAADGSFAAHWLAGTYGDRLYLLVSVRDAEIRYERPDLDPEQTDQVLLRMGQPQRDVRLAVSAPGPFSHDGRRGFYLPLQGAWQETPDGYRLELSLPLAAAADGFGFAVLDVSPSFEQNWTIRSLGLIDPERVELLPRVIAGSDALQHTLLPYLQAGSRISVVNAEGWLLASAGETLTETSDYGSGAAAPAGSWWVRLLRAVLEDDAPRSQGDDFRRGRLRGEAVRAALAGTVGYDWFARAGEPQAVLAAAHPIEADSKVVGAILIEQTTDAIASLSNQALLRLLGLSFGVLLTILLVLLGFASLLSWRVRRLRNQVERAISPEGRLGAPFQPTRTADELGDLSRSFAQILRDLRGYTDYLESFAAKLSHELKTPLAIVKSSLENLEMDSPGSESSRYLTRARQGIDRLSQILYAMREAARLEQSIRDTEKETFDLTAVLQDAAPAYLELLPEHRWQWELPPHPVGVHGSPELLIQLIDKLVDNARDFTPPGGLVRLCLQATERQVLLDVENQGPALPHGDLFASFVSVREPSGQEGHLGLGLVIVRLIAEFHQGSARAENLADGSGVRIRIRLPYTTSVT